MGNPIPELDDKRNKELVADYKKKDGDMYSFAVIQLIAKYQISATRIYEILAKYKVETRNK